MGLNVVSIASQPCYLITAQRDSDKTWTSNALFETTLQNLDFTPSSECVALKFVSKEEAETMHVFITVREFLKQYDPTNLLLYCRYETHKSTI